MKQLAEVEAKNLALGNESKRVCEDNDRLKSSEAQAMEQVFQCKKDVQKSESEMDQLQQQIADLAAKNLALQEQVNQASLNSDSLMKQQVDKIADLENTNLALQTELKSMQEDKDRLLLAETQLNQQITEYMESTKNIETLMAQQSEKVAQLESKNLELQEELKQLQEDIERLKLSEAQLKEQCAPHKEDIQNRQTQMEQQNSQVAKLEASGLALKEHLKLLQEDNERLILSETQLKEQITEYMEAIQNIKTLMEQQSGEVSHLESKNLELQVELKRLQETISGAQLKEQCTQTKEATQNSMSEMEQKKDRVNELKATNLALQAELDRLQEENDSLKSWEAQLKKQCTECREEIQKERTKSSSAQQELAKFKEICRTQRTYMDRYKSELESSVSMTRAREMESTIAELTDRLGRHAEEFDSKLMAEKRKQEQLYKKFCEQSDLRLKAAQQLIKLNDELARVRQAAAQVGELKQSTLENDD
ncbi:hypothetical protein BOX15_Mlig003505g1 [Macrostomum lignano]|uniref:Uncharacterized protein n=1 Tax=Macrostomum lignano TaxID=282301 RepID=A0A267FB24_9PLAT|nr:hypothetical protein BOX15_Mlig003505g1 [Macrostomum lignano]